MISIDDFDILSRHSGVKVRGGERLLTEVTNPDDSDYQVYLQNDERLLFFGKSGHSSYRLEDFFVCYMVQGPYLFVVTRKDEEYHLTKFHFDQKTNKITYNVIGVNKNGSDEKTYYITNGICGYFYYFEKKGELLISKGKVDIRKILPESVVCDADDSNLEIFDEDGKTKVSINCHLTLDLSDQP